MKKVESFSGGMRFLSNFWYNPDGYTNEHRFQAAKAKHKEHYDWVMESKSPGEAKRRGRQVPMREDWDDIRIAVMLELTTKKFEDPDLRRQLLMTGDWELIEGNTWGDRFWGVCDGEGQNWLGQCLMKVREDIRNEERFKCVS